MAYSHGRTRLNYVGVPSQGIGARECYRSQARKDITIKNWGVAGHLLIVVKCAKWANWGVAVHLLIVFSGRTNALFHYLCLRFASFSKSWVDSRKGKMAFTQRKEEKKFLRTLRSFWVIFFLEFPDGRGKMKTWRK